MCSITWLSQLKKGSFISSVSYIKKVLFPIYHKLTFYYKMNISYRRPKTINKKYFHVIFTWILDIIICYFFSDIFLFTSLLFFTIIIFENKLCNSLNTRFNSPCVNLISDKNIFGPLLLWFIYKYMLCNNKEPFQICLTEIN